VAYNCPEALPRRRLEVLGSGGQLLALDTMGQTAGGTATRIDGASGAASPLPFDGDSPFLRQVRAFGDALRSGEHAAFSASRDLHTTRLVAQAYGAGAAKPRVPTLA
jgi:predicted dehydrogenase